MTNQFPNSGESPVKLVQTILLFNETLGLYQAELVRILAVQCGDIGELFSGKRNIEPDSHLWEKSVFFIRFYELLYDKLKGDEVAMYNWLRRHNSDLNGTPLFLLVDNGNLEAVAKYLK